MCDSNFAKWSLWYTLQINHGRLHHRIPSTIEFLLLPYGTTVGDDFWSPIPVAIPCRMFSAVTISQAFPLIWNLGKHCGLWLSDIRGSMIRTNSSCMKGSVPMPRSRAGPSMRPMDSFVVEKKLHDLAGVAAVERELDTAMLVPEIPE